MSAPANGPSYTYPTTQAAQPTSAGHVQVQSLREWQVQLADYLIANPQPTLRELSAHFRRTPAWISSVIHTDAFKAYLGQRRRELNQAVDAEGGHLQTLKERLESTAHLALNELSDRLGDTTLAMTVPTKDVTRAAEVTLRALGFGPAQGNAPTQVNVENNVFVLTREQLEAARAKRRALVSQEAGREAVDGYALEIQAQPTQSTSLAEEEARYFATPEHVHGGRQLPAAAGVYTEWDD